MTQDAARSAIASRRVVYTTPGQDTTSVERDIPYKTVDGETLTFDVYYPSARRGLALLPAVFFVTGYPDAGMQTMVGCKAKEMGVYVSWAQLAAASGVAAITYSPSNPVTDASAVIKHACQHAGSLRIDPQRLGLWSCSGNVPTALSVLMGDERNRLKCAVLCCGYTLDLDASTAVADAATMFRFANPCVGRSVADLPRDLPLFIARAGRDEMPGLNAALDRFVAHALQANLPIAIENHASGPHAFDVMDDSDISRHIIKHILVFLQFHLLARYAHR